MVGDVAQGHGKGLQVWFWARAPRERRAGFAWAAL
jgi:hypothetical protein